MTPSSAQQTRRRKKHGVLRLSVLLRLLSARRNRNNGKRAIFCFKFWLQGHVQISGSPQPKLESWAGAASEADTWRNAHTRIEGTEGAPTQRVTERVRACWWKYSWPTQVVLGGSWQHCNRARWPIRPALPPLEDSLLVEAGLAHSSELHLEFQRRCLAASSLHGVVCCVSGLI